MNKTLSKGICRMSLATFFVRSVIYFVCNYMRAQNCNLFYICVQYVVDSMQHLSTCCLQHLQYTHIIIKMNSDLFQVKFPSNIIMEGVGEFG